MGATLLLPDRINDVIFPAVLDWALDYPQSHGVRRPKEGILSQIASKGRIPVLDVGTMRKIADGAIKLATEIAEVRDRNVIFRDGATGQFDAMIFATGYKPNYSKFLSRTEVCPETLHFVGFKSPVTGLLREISREAVRLAARIGTS